MKVIRPEGFQKIHQGLLAGLIIFLISNSVSFFMILYQEIAYSFSATPWEDSVTIICDALYILANIVVINGLIESSDSLPEIRPARLWMLVSLIDRAVDIACNGITNTLEKAEEILPLAAVSVILFAIGIISSYLAIRFILIGFHKVWHICGGDEKYHRKINMLRRQYDIFAAISALNIVISLVLLSILLLSPETFAKIKIPPDLSFIFIFEILLLVLWYLVLRIRTVRTSGKVAKTIKEISQ